MQFAQYKDWTLVVKEFRRRNGRENERLKREVIHEANTVASLGVYQGLKVLFGVRLESKLKYHPMVFYSFSEQKITVWCAASKKKLNKDEWMSVLDNQSLKHHSTFTTKDTYT